MQDKKLTERSLKRFLSLFILQLAVTYPESILISLKSWSLSFANCSWICEKTMSVSSFSAFWLSPSLVKQEVAQWFISRLAIFFTYKYKIFVFSCLCILVFSVKSPYFSNFVPQKNLAVLFYIDLFPNFTAFCYLSLKSGSLKNFWKVTKKFF